MASTRLAFSWKGEGWGTAASPSCIPTRIPSLNQPGDGPNVGFVCYPCLPRMIENGRTNRWLMHTVPGGTTIVGCPIGITMPISYTIQRWRKKCFISQTTLIYSRHFNE